MNFEIITTGLLVVIVVVAWLIDRRSSRRPVKVDENGVLITRSLAKPIYLPWEEIESFGVASASRLEGGLHLNGFTQYVGVKLSDSSPRKTTQACQENRRLSDYDILFTPDHGMTIDQFSAHLEDERIKFRKG